MMARVFRLALTLWAGSLWAVAAWVVPTVFHGTPDRHLAGQIAGRIFACETYAGLVAAALALCFPWRRRFALGFAAAGLLCLNEWAVRFAMERALAAGAWLGAGFLAWHGISACVYLAACVLVAIVIWRDEPREG